MARTVLPGHCSLSAVPLFRFGTEGRLDMLPERPERELQVA